MRSRLFWTVLAATLAAAAPAHADPVSALIVTALTYIGVSATVAGVNLFLISTALSAALSYAQQLLAGKPKSGVGGSSGKIQTGGVIPRSFIVGTGMTGGKLAYANTWGTAGKTPNGYFTYVIAAQDLPAVALRQVLVGTTLGTISTDGTPTDWGHPVPEFNKGGKDYLWFRFYDGTQTEADSWLVSQFGSDPVRPYDSNRIGKGVAYVIMTARYSTEVFSGYPQYKLILDGTRFYDPRKDSTAGGSGSHRWADQTTWELSANPKVIEYNILRGMTFGGEYFYGLQGINAARLPLDAWFAAMNECDVAIDQAAGGTVPQYCVGGEVSVDTQPADLIDELNKSCGGGRTAESGGVYKPYVGPAGTSVLSFTDSDIIVSQQQTFDQFPSISDTINGATASYPDPTSAWNPKDAPPLYNSDLETADGGRELTADIQYNLVPFPEQVQRMMASAVAEARRFRKHVIVLPPSVWGLECVDFVSWTSARNGYENKLFRIDSGTDGDNLDIGIGITEVDPSDYDWDPSLFVVPTNAPLALVRPPSQAIAGWTAEAVTVDGDDGRQKAAIRLSWDTDDIDDVDGVLYQARLTSTAALVLAGETAHSIDNFDLGYVDIGQNLSSDTAYQVRGKYRPISNRATDWSDWIDVTTDDIRLSAIDLYDKAVGSAQLSDEINTDLAQIATNTDAIAAEVAARALADTGLQTAKANSDGAIRGLKGDVAQISAALVNIHLLIPQLEQTYQLQVAAYVQTVFGGDVTNFTARMTTVENAVIDLDAGKAEASDLSALDAQINTPGTGLEALVGSLSDTVALLDPLSASATLTQTVAAALGMKIQFDNLSTTMAQTLAALNNLQTGQSATLAYYRNEISTQVTKGQSANADAIGQVGALLSSNVQTLTANITTEQNARISGDTANASSITTILAALSGLTGSGAVNAAITSEATTRAAADIANASSITTILAALSGLTGSGAVNAAITSEATTRAAADIANASSITTILAALSGLTGSGAVNAAITSEATTRASADGANASSISTVGTNLGKVNAGGYFSVATSTTPGDAEARIALGVSATSGGAAQTAAIFLDALSGGTSRAIIVAGQTFIASGSDKAALSSAFEFDSGTLFVKNAVIPNIAADKITTGTLNVDALTVTGTFNGSNIADQSVVIRNKSTAWVGSGITSQTSIGTASYTIDSSLKPIIVCIAGWIHVDSSTYSVKLSMTPSHSYLSDSFGLDNTYSKLIMTDDNNTNHITKVFVCETFADEPTSTTPSYDFYLAANGTITSYNLATWSWQMNR